MEWQPIETAPKDGTRLDLWSHHGFRMPDCTWDVITYSEEMDGRDEMGWTSAHHHGSVMEAAPFTHWRPLPDPPTQNAKD